MKKKIQILLAAAVATATIGAATFALAGASSVGCCKIGNACCITKQACCK
jgi:hypothetical protein